MRHSKLVLALFAPVVLSLSARAGDWYVDALNGSNANNGLTPGSAWKTITHALGTIPTAPASHTLHIAPGTYGPALGESFPLVMRPALRFVGDQGSASTILAGAGATLLLFDSDFTSTGYTFDAASGADGLTLQNSDVGIVMGTDWNPVSPSFHDLVIQGMSGDGVTISTYGFGSHLAHPTFDHVSVLSCNRGFDVDAAGSTSSSFGTSIVDLTDCTVNNNTLEGLLISGGHGTAQANLVRCRLMSNLGDGVRLSAGTQMQSGLMASATLIAGNQGSGVGGSGSTMAHGVYQLSDCTIANNALNGLSPMTGSGMTQTTTLRNCILYGNSNDFVGGPSGPVSTAYCDSGDGDLLGQPGCIAADPLFVNPGNGDYRLKFGSPCVETGDPASNSALDLVGHARPLDGNLDTIGAVDMGAIEFETMHFRGKSSIGQLVGFELWGAAGSTSIVRFSAQALTPAQSTAFGNFYLAPGTFVTLGTVAAAPGPPNAILRVLPNNPLLIGMTFSYQAQTSSALAPLGQAYTNPISFVVQP